MRYVREDCSFRIVADVVCSLRHQAVSLVLAVIVCPETVLLHALSIKDTELRWRRSPLTGR